MQTSDASGILVVSFHREDVERDFAERRIEFDNGEEHCWEELFSEVAMNDTLKKYRRIAEHLMADALAGLSLQEAVQIINSARTNSLPRDLIREAYKHRRKRNRSELRAARSAVSDALAGLTEVDASHNRLPTRLVTLRGECFEVKFEGFQNSANGEGVVHRFGLTDLTSKRGIRKVSVFRARSKHFYVSNLAEYDRRIDTVLLNTIRRAFDSGVLTFDAPKGAAPDKEIALDPLDFRQQVQRDDREISLFIVHTGYWLSYSYGRRYPVQLDSEADLEYLGATAEDIGRNEESLKERGALDKASGRGIPTMAQVKLYENILFQEQSERGRIDEISQEVEEGIGVPSVSLFVPREDKGKASGIADGAAIVFDRHGDIGMASEAPFPVAVSYCADNSNGARYIQRALAAANMMQDWRLKNDRKLLVSAEDFVYIGWLDLEHKCINVHDPIALTDWLGVELVSNNELIL